MLPPSNIWRQSALGYALVETLIAAGIAAAVVAGVATTVSGSVQAHNATTEIAVATSELKNIIAGAKAGLSLRDLSSAYPDFSIELSSVELSNTPGPGDVRPVRVTIIHRERPNVAAETIILVVEEEP